MATSNFPRQEICSLKKRQGPKQGRGRPGGKWDDIISLDIYVAVQILMSKGLRITEAKRAFTTGYWNDLSVRQLDSALKEGAKRWSNLSREDKVEALASEDVYGPRFIALLNDIQNIPRK